MSGSFDNGDAVEYEDLSSTIKEACQQERNCIIKQLRQAKLSESSSTINGWTLGFNGGLEGSIAIIKEAGDE